MCPSRRCKAAHAASGASTALPVALLEAPEAVPAAAGAPSRPEEANTSSIAVSESESISASETAAKDGGSSSPSTSANATAIAASLDVSAGATSPRRVALARLDGASAATRSVESWFRARETLGDGAEGRGAGEERRYLVRRAPPLTRSAHEEHLAPVAPRRPSLA